MNKSDMTVNTINDKIEFIEMVLGLKLLDWQKKALKQIDSGAEELVWIPGKASGKTVYAKAVKILHQLNKSLENNEGWENDDPTSWKEYKMRFE
jgi:hypothetical protein